MDGYEDLEEGSSPGGPAPPKEGETKGGESALIPKSLLMGKEYKVGETIPLKVVHIFEDEVEVQCEPYEKSEDKEEMSEMESSETMLDGMAVPPA